MNGYGIVVGINEYRDTWIEPLRFAEKDAVTICDLLAKRDTLGFLRQNIKLLVGQDAIRKNIVEALQEFSTKDDGADMLFFYFSGHGLRNIDPNVDNSYLATYDIDPFEPQIAGIGMKEFYEEYISKSKAKNVLAIIDSCYSGATTEYKAISDLELQAIRLFQQQEGRYVLTSCSKDQKSKEDEKLKHGIFTYYLVRGINTEEAADKKTGELTIPLLFSYTGSRIRQDYGIEQEPHWGGRGKSILIRKFQPTWDKIMDYHHKSGKPHCSMCGAKFSVDNMYICMSCGRDYCYHCVWKLEKVDEEEKRRSLGSDWKCLCGGRVS